MVNVTCDLNAAREIREEKGMGGKRRGRRVGNGGEKDQFYQKGRGLEKKKRWYLININVISVCLYIKL